MDRESLTLDDVIAAYLQAWDDGTPPDPRVFIERWPEHREAFLRFVGRTKHLDIFTDTTEFELNPLNRMQRSVAPILTVIGGFGLGQVIGDGGMSRVYEAKSLRNGQAAAVKILDTSKTNGPSLQSRFRREAQAVQSLDHEHIVPLLDYGSEQGVPYLAFRLIEGCTLAGLIAAWREAECIDEQLDVNESCDSKAWAEKALKCFAEFRTDTDRYRDVARLVADAADALHSAHQQGIVHRDVKPSNLMIDLDGHLWLTDFGLASIGETQTVLTQTDQVVGTPNYMSPEQASGGARSVDHRSDVFSLGATLYELATLERPFQGNRFRVLLDISSGRLTPPCRVRSDIPRPLEAIILKAMEQAPTDRYPSAAQMAEDLRRFASGHAPLARAPGITDAIVRWLLRNPKTSITSVAAVVGTAMLVLTLQYRNASRLSKINASLTTTNTKLEQTNSKLELSNTNLDRSRDKLRRHLYVADLAAAYRAYAQNDIDSVKQLLERHVSERDSDEADDLRGFEWWLLDNLTRAPELTRLNGHDGPARELAVVPGRREVVSVGDDGRVRHWNLETSTQRNEFKIGGQLESIAVSADGARLVAGANANFAPRPLRVLDLATGEVICELTPHMHSVESAAFSPDGKLVATADRYHDVQLHDATTGELLGLVSTGSRNESLGFSSDGKLLYAILRVELDGNRKQYLSSWSIPELEEHGTREFGSSVEVFAFSGNGRRLLVGHPGGIILTEGPQRQLVLEQDNVRGRIRCVALDESGHHIAAGCDNGTVYLWQQGDNKKTASPRAILTGEKRVTSIKFLDPHTIVATSEDGSVQVWSMNTTSSEIMFGLSTRAIAIPSGNNDLLFLRGDNGGVERLRLSNLDDYQRIARIPPDDDFQIAATDAGNVIVAATPGALVVLSGADGSQHHQIKSGLPKKSCVSLRFASDDAYLVALYNDRVRRYRTSDWSLEKEVILESEGAEEFAFSPDGSTMLIATRNNLLSFDATSLRPKLSLPGRLGEFGYVDYSADGRLIAVGHSDGSVELLTSSGLQRQKLLRGHRDSVRCCLFLENDRTLVTSSYDHTVRFWDVESGRELGVLRGEQIGFHFLHFDATSQRLFGFRPHLPSHVWSAQR